MPMASRMPGIASSTSTPRISRLSTFAAERRPTAPMSATEDHASDDTRDMPATEADWWRRT